MGLERGKFLKSKRREKAAEIKFLLPLSMTGKNCFPIAGNGIRKGPADFLLRNPLDNSVVFA